MNISKRKLWRYINKITKRMIHHYHVFSVITLLFEEMLIDLKNDKEIHIFNFGRFSLRKTKPRKHYNIVTGTITSSPGYKMMYLHLDKKLKKFLITHLDIMKTFGN